MKVYKKSCGYYKKTEIQNVKQERALRGAFC